MSTQESIHFYLPYSGKVFQQHADDRGFPHGHCLFPSHHDASRRLI